MEYKTYVKSDSETWTSNKKDQNVLEALKMWFQRKMEKIKWTKRKKNKEVLNVVEEKK